MDSIWNIPTSDSVHDNLLGFGYQIGYSWLVDILPIFLKDYIAANSYCSIKIKAFNNPSVSPVGIYDVDTLLKASHMYGGFNFYSHEYPDSTRRPQIIVYSVDFGVVFPTDKHGLISFCNYPNPFTTKTEIRVKIPETRSQKLRLRSEIKIYDLVGRVVKTFLITSY